MRVELSAINVCVAGVLIDERTLDLGLVMLAIWLFSL
jgi:hypothetical protein